MKQNKQQQIYVSPDMETIETNVQAIICQSGNTEQYDNVFGNDWFDVQE